jgi:hypothetical protein
MAEIEKRPRLTVEEVKVLMTRVLQAYARCGVIGIACDEACVKRSMHKAWLQHYPRYKELFDELQDRFVDGIEKVGIEKAKSGSDGMIQFMLKAHRREVYGDKSDVNVKGGVAPITLIFAEGMLNEEDQKLIEEASGNKKIGVGGVIDE